MFGVRLAIFKETYVGLGHIYGLRHVRLLKPIFFYFFLKLLEISKAQKEKLGINEACQNDFIYVI